MNAGIRRLQTKRLGPHSALCCQTAAQVSGLRLRSHAAVSFPAILLLRWIHNLDNQPLRLKHHIHGTLTRLTPPTDADYEPVASYLHGYWLIPVHVAAAP